MNELLGWLGDPASRGFVIFLFLAYGSGVAIGGAIFHKRS